MPTLFPQERKEAATEVHAIPLPPVEVELWHLDVRGAGGGSPYIIRDNEEFSLSVDLRFSGGALVDLLMCVGLAIDVEFAIEGFGKAPEVNLSAPTVITEKGKYEYQPTLTIPGGPAAEGLKPGVYKAVAMMTVKAAGQCADVGPVVFGYISDVVFQVYSH